VTLLPKTRDVRCFDRCIKDSLGRGMSSAQARGLPRTGPPRGSPLSRLAFRRTVERASRMGPICGVAFFPSPTKGLFSCRFEPLGTDLCILQRLYGASHRPPRGGPVALHPGLQDESPVGVPTRLSVGRRGSFESVAIQSIELPFVNLLAPH
jgi:hypothetical protein